MILKFIIATYFVTICYSQNSDDETPNIVSPVLKSAPTEIIYNEFRKRLPNETEDSIKEMIKKWIGTNKEKDKFLSKLNNAKEVDQSEDFSEDECSVSQEDCSSRIPIEASLILTSLELNVKARDLEMEANIYKEEALKLHLSALKILKSKYSL